MKKWYKVWNLFLAYLDLLLRREKPHADPVELSVGTTSFCNLRCIQCPREGHEGNLMPFDEHLDLAYYQSLEPYLKRAKEVSLYGLGEPMIDKRYFDKVRYVTSFGAEVSLSSNGTLMDERRCREIIESGIKSIGISLDAAREETFAVVRPPGGLPAIVENIKRLSRMKKEQGTLRPLIRLSFGIMPQNLEDLPLFPDLAAEAGGEEIIVHSVIFMSEAKRRELTTDPQKVRPAIEAARARARELGIAFCVWDLDPFTYLKSLRYVRGESEASYASSSATGRSSHGYFCFFLWRNAMIQGHGELFPCCYMTNKRLGRLQNGNLLELRGHPFLAELRRRLYEGDPPEPCAGCPQLYPYDRQNILKSGLQEMINLIRS
ncbi:MAG: radical SAM protein [Candidatus Omnitrophica bacterium]|nr:radical SAM protein [Candidatus Omnitrophota bacterium]